MKKIKLIVLYGGQSGEHEISIKSAQSVIRSLAKNKYQVIPIYINRQGRWLIRKTESSLLPEYFDKVSNSFSLQPDRAEIEKPVLKNPMIPRQILQQPIVVFPVLHGPGGEDGTIQGMLEILKVPYVGSGVLGSALCLDKAMTKKILGGEGLPVLDYLVIKTVDWQRKQKTTVNYIKKHFTLPIFIKPANLGSSIGISKVNQWSMLVPAINIALHYDVKIIIEKAAANCREIEVSILGGDDPRASVPGEIIPGSEFYDYHAKYLDQNSTLVVPAKLPQKVTKHLQALAIKAFLATECCGMARVDFFVAKKTNQIFLNEINTIPGFTSISMYPKLWEKSGLGYSELLDQLIQLAINKFQQKSKVN